MTVSSPSAIEIKLDRLIDDMRLVRSQMIAFDRRLKEIELRDPSQQQLESKSTPSFAAAAINGKDSFDSLCSRGSNQRSLALSGNMTRQRTDRSPAAVLVLANDTPRGWKFRTKHK